MGHLSWLTSMSAWFTLTTTTFMIVARVSLVWLLRLYKYEQIHPATWYLVLLVLLTGPHVTNLLYSLWVTPILSAVHRVNLPSGSRIILGLLTGIIESTATCLFVCEVAHSLPEPVLITLPSATLILVVFTDVYKHLKTTNSPTSLSVLDKLDCYGHMISVGYMIVVVTVVASLLCEWSNFNLTKEGCVLAVLCTPLIAAVWYPRVQKLFQRTNRSSSIIDLLYIFIKIVFICVTLFLSIFFKLDEFRNYPWPCILLGLSELSKFTIWFPLACCCCAGAFSFLNVWASFKVGLSAPGVKLPFILCVPLSIVITAILWNDFETGAFWEVTANDIYSWVAIGLSAICWFIPFCLPAFSGFKRPHWNCKPFIQRINDISWNAFFLETKLLMINYEESDEQSLPEATDPFPTLPTVYICSTMYKENQLEMVRYLTSIKNVFENNDEKSLRLEAHVFFDNSIRSNRINARGRQLLHLLCETFQVELSQLVKFNTPYGCQVHTSALFKYSLFIHFKDETKVKGKKRWSQVMYLNYVLNHRHHLAHNYGYERRETLDGRMQPTNQSSNSLSLENSLKFPANKRPNIPCVKRSYTACEGNILNSLDLGSSPLASSTLNYQEVRTRENDMDQSLCPIESSHYTNCSFSICSGSEHSIQSFNTDITFTYDNAKVFMTKSSTLQNEATYDNVFILTTDADTEFTSETLKEVLEKCKSDANIGAVCGRTVPIGNMKPIVWYQKFEYAKDFWLVKSSQNVIGSVTCCPGCFSIYRGAAMATVLPEFCKPTNSAFDNLVMDHGEDRWLCTLLMRGGWRLAYSSQAHNSTHCPETIGEFLRQRRRWVLSELSNTADIFMSITKLIKNNASFSVMFLISLMSTFLWVILSPATTVVFMSAGFDVLFNIPMTFTLPSGLGIFLAYCLVCCLANQDRQKIVSILFISLLAAIILSLTVGFVLYILNCIETDLRDLGYIQFRPFFLVFLLVIAIVYAAILHPMESFCLIYGFAYAFLFPAMFVVLPVYGVANMLDQSWGTREAGTHGCCQVSEEEEDDTIFKNYEIKVSSLKDLSSTPDGATERVFWTNLMTMYIGIDVNKGKPGDLLSKDLHHLRSHTMLGLIVCNVLWFICLSVIYSFAGSDVICFCVAAIFSFSLLIQLVGLTCFKVNNLIESNLKKNVNDIFQTEAQKSTCHLQRAVDPNKVTLHRIFQEEQL